MIEKGFESVTIGAVEKHITETAFAEGWVKPAGATQRADGDSWYHWSRSGWFVGCRDAASSGLSGSCL